MAWGPAEPPLQPEEPRDGDQTSGERLGGSRMQAEGQNGRKVISGVMVVVVVLMVMVVVVIVMVLMKGSIVQMDSLIASRLFPSASQEGRCGY